MKIAAIQMSSTDRVEDNLKTVERLLNQARNQGAKLAVLPENVAFMGKNETDKLKIAEVLGKGPIQDFLSNLAKQLGIELVGGTIPIVAAENRVYSACLVWDTQGFRVARYDKIHLFDVVVQPGVEEYKESNTIYPGSSDLQNRVAVDSSVGKLGLSVCYDLRFPELYRSLFTKGAEVLLVPSAFTALTGSVHWEPLLRARAIENFCYVVAPNQVGIHPNGRATYGHSMIIDPWGSIMAELSEGEGIVVAELNLNHLHDLRKRFPVALHRRIF